MILDDIARFMELTKPKAIKPKTIAEVLAYDKYTLAWRVTKGGGRQLCQQKVSTHTLAWRVTPIHPTVLVVVGCFNTHSRTESDVK